MENTKLTKPQQIIFEVYDKGVQNEDCDLDKYVEKMKRALSIADIIASAEFEKDLEKAIKEGNEVGYNAGGGYNYYCEITALREVLKVIKNHLL